MALSPGLLLLPSLLISRQIPASPPEKILDWQNEKGKKVEQTCADEGRCSTTQFW
jgi:hypothetical protein